MFFGLVLKANRKYTQTIKKAFHLSQAALDITSCGDDPVQLILVSEKTSYILCTLRKNSVEQVPLDLSFAEGDEISFLSQGKGNVHLSGYLVDDDYLGADEELDLVEALKENALKKQKKDKKKGQKSSDDEDDDAEDDDDDDDDDDGDDNDEEGDLEESDDDEEAEDEEDEEEDGDDSGEDSEEEVKEPAPKKEKLEKPKQNGVEKPSKKDKKNKEQSQPQQQQKQKGEKTLQGGVKVEDIKVGGGPEAKAGKKVSVYYEGRLKSNNKVFDSTKTGNAFKFALGNGDVIKGWDVGVVGMKVGGKRKITCPPNAAYGAKGSPPVIPPNSTLVFEVELKGVH